MVQMILSDKVLDTPKTVRVKFRKVGALQYISHLDLVRTMTRVVLRARLPLWYSEGFNPRPKLTFATPMSVGAQSVSELLDIRVNKEVDTAAVKEALNMNLPSELSVEKVYYPSSKFSDLMFSSYNIIIKTEGADADLATKCDALLNSGEVTVFKKSKAGDRDVNISSMIRSAKCEYNNGLIEIKCTLAADNAGFLNPEYLVTFLKEKCGILSAPLDREYYEIIRYGVFKADMTEFI